MCHPEPDSGAKDSALEILNQVQDDKSNELTK